MTTKTQTPQEISTAINVWFDSIVSGLEAVSDRWQDERQYEDFADYEKWLRNALPSNFVFVKATKRPFGVQFRVIGDDSNGLFCCFVKSSCVGWGRLS